MYVVASPSQTAFIPGCAITENILVFYVVMHFLNRKTQGWQGYEALKVDMAKAYNRVDGCSGKIICLKWDSTQNVSDY